MSYPTVKEIGNLDADTFIPELRLNVKSVFDAVNEGTPKQRQAAFLRDDTGEIRATFWQAAHNLKNFKGNDIKISGKGIKVVDRETKGVVSRELSISETAKIDELVEDTAMQSTVGKKSSELPMHEMTASEASAASGQPLRVRTYESDEVKRASIERQQALEQAVSYMKYHARSSGAKAVVAVAEQFYLFLSGQLAPTPEPEQTPEQEAPASGATEVF